MSQPPRLELKRLPSTWAAGPDPLAWDWGMLPTLAPFTRADGGDLAAQQTVARLGFDAEALYVRFDCEDHDIWGSYTRRDEPLYDEEVVELFIAPGEATPTSYYELEISPDGVLLDARISNPRELRAELLVDLSWDAEARWWARRDDDAGRWLAIIALPWRCLVEGPPPPTWRINLTRIERPRGGPPEFSCWSPTLTEPADFHRPSRFGYLTLA